jgi:MSHA biogenesis protein MshJ
MKDMFARLRSRFEVLNRRERIFVAIASWLVVLFVLDAVAVGPARQQNAAMMKAVSQKQGEAARLEAELAVLRSRQSEDPDAQAKRRIADLENRIAAIDARLETVSSRIVPPDRMAGLLDQLLRRNKRLQLVSLRSLPPELLVKEEQAGKKEGAGKEPSQPQAGMLYRHGMELTLGGSYLDMLDYVRSWNSCPGKCIGEGWS